MISLEEIEKYYTENLKPFKRSILREYLQYKILEIIFDSEYASKLSFLGGTALRIVHDNTRFSEDIDLDNFGLTEMEFDNLASIIKKGLQFEGYGVEIRNVYKRAFRCYIKIPDLLFDSGLTGHKEEKILVQLDSAHNDFVYTQEKYLLNKFDVLTEINITPMDIILSQKILALFGRKRAKGRDFYDIVFLLGKTKPNYQYLDKKTGIRTEKELKKKLLEKANQTDLNAMAKDVEKFLFNPKDSKKIVLFKQFIKQVL